MKILVLAETYPMPGGVVGPMYIHMRNVYYKNMGADVTVLNFRAKESAEFEGIPVITFNKYKKIKDQVSFDILILHAANIRHHYMFLKKYGMRFPRYVFIFHGHEVLRKSTVYPPLFLWKKQSNPILVLARDIYDSLKLRVWKHFFENKKNMAKSQLIFVSEWMKNEFLKNTKISIKVVEKNSHVIYNSIGKQFEMRHYDNREREYDFITIRRNIDGEKYCVDVVNELAKNNPQYKFLLFGKGELFKHVEKAENLDWKDRNLFHEEMFEWLNKCRFALMPTKTDAQGLMMCEMASYGIPVITSDIPVCHEVLDEFENVSFISNSGKDDLINNVYKLMGKETLPKNEKFYEANTSGKEFELLMKMVEN